VENTLVVLVVMMSTATVEPTGLATVIV
jgi:hypothetical protein